MTAQPLEQVAAWIDRLVADAGAERFDSQSLALIMVESLSAYWLMRQSPGRVPGDLNDERFIATWVDLGSPTRARRGSLLKPPARRDTGRPAADHPTASADQSDGDTGRPASRHAWKPPARSVARWKPSC
jgi:hypothetical protein